MLVGLCSLAEADWCLAKDEAVYCGAELVWTEPFGNCFLS